MLGAVGRSIVLRNNVVVATRRGINFIGGAGITVADDSGNERVNVTIDGTTWVPVGSMIGFAGSSAPDSSWLICDGSAIGRTLYRALYDAIGTAYGVGDGSTTFNLPDLRGRVPVGKGTNAAVSTLGNNDGVAVGNRRPQHRHDPHSHQIPIAGGAGGANVAGPGTVFGGGYDNTTLVDGGSRVATDSLDAPAYAVINYIIKATS